MVVIARQNALSVIPVGVPKIGLGAKFTYTSLVQYSNYIELKVRILCCVLFVVVCRSRGFFARDTRLTARSVFAHGSKLVFLAFCFCLVVFRRSCG
jgi:hypothetical protein